VWLWLLLVSTLLLAGPGRAAEIATASPAELIAELDRGNPIVIVVWNETAPKSTDESYGDWADTLNNFAARADGRVKIIKMAALAYRLAVVAPRISGQFATLFVRNLQNTLLYQGMILEPQVYQLGQNYILAQTESPAATKYGLTPTAIHLRHGKTRGELETPATRTHSYLIAQSIMELLPADAKQRSSDSSRSK
jgi:hypothetical protein